MNVCSFIGNVGRDPETRQVGSSSVTNFSLGCSERWKDKDGNKQEKTEWVNFQAWGKQGEVIAQYVTKGSRLWVSGSMETRKYQDNNGVDKYSTTIKVKDFEFQPSANSGGQSQGGYQETPASRDSGDVPF